MPKKYMTPEVLAEELAKFEWPAPYTLEDDRPDGIAMVFPKCNLYFEEGVESDMQLKVLAEGTGLDTAVSLQSILVSMGGVRGRAPGLIDDHLTEASLERVKIGVHNLCTILLTHLPNMLLGDFSWVEGYKAYVVRQMRALGFGPLPPSDLLYMPKKYMTPEVLAEELAKFEWPAPYTLEDDEPDGIAMVFPKCMLYFEEGFESDMELSLFAEGVGLEYSVTLSELLFSMGGVGGRTPGLIPERITGASLEKVKIGVHNLCTIILTHFPNMPLGDFSWVEGYKAYLARRKRGS